MIDNDRICGPFGASWSLPLPGRHGPLCVAAAPSHPSASRCDAEVETAAAAATNAVRATSSKLNRPLLAIDTLAVERHDGDVKLTPPGRLVIALNRTGDLWIVAWQNARSGEVKEGLFHRDPAAAFEDLALRCRRAGARTLRPEVGERLP